MARYAWNAEGRKYDALDFTDGDWLNLAQAARTGATPLHCDDCLQKGYPYVPLRLRTTVHVRRHFFHLGGVPRGCTNVDHENESDAHKTLKDLVASAYETVPDITAAKELSLRDSDGELIRVDVAAQRGLEPVSLAEIQLSPEPVDGLWKRNLQRRSALGVARDGYARTTPWLTTRADRSWYGSYPALYLSQDGQRVTDGIYAPHPSGGGDLDQPIAFDLDEWAAATLKPGQLIQIGGPEDSEAYWVDNRRNLARPPAKGKRRKPRTLDERPLPQCDRPQQDTADTSQARTLTLTSVQPDRGTALGAPTHILAASMQGKWHRPPLQPWLIELDAGPYRGCVIEVYKLGPYVTVIGEHGRVGYARDETVEVEPFRYRFDKVL